MSAGLDMLLIAVFCTADGFVRERLKNAICSVDRAEVVTPADAEAMMTIGSVEQSP